MRLQTGYVCSLASQIALSFGVGAEQKHKQDIMMVTPKVTLIRPVESSVTRIKIKASDQRMF